MYNMMYVLLAVTGELVTVSNRSGHGLPRLGASRPAEGGRDQLMGLGQGQRQRVRPNHVNYVCSI